MTDRLARVGTGKLTLRPAEPNDVEPLHRFVVELDRTDDAPADVSSQPSDLAAALFGPHPIIEAVIAVMDGERVGAAIHYPTYSTTLGRRGIHLEDLYVSPHYRGCGVGQELLRHLAELAVNRGCARLEWWVLRTNDDAVRFYRRLGAHELDDVAVMRLDGHALAALGCADDRSRQ